MKFNTKVIHGGQHHEKVTGSVNVPVFLTSTFAQSSPGQHSGYEYSRAANPTRQALEDALASIENGARGLAFGSGLAAIDCVLSLDLTQPSPKPARMNRSDGERALELT